MTNRGRAEDFLSRVSNSDSWLDCSSEYAKRELTRLLDEVVKETLSRERLDRDSLDIESGLLDD